MLYVRRVGMDTFDEQNKLCMSISMYVIETELNNIFIDKWSTWYYDSVKTLIIVRV